MTTLAEATIKDYLQVRIFGNGIPTVAFFARVEGYQATPEVVLSVVEQHLTIGDCRNRQGLLDGSTGTTKALAKPRIPKAADRSTR